MSSAWIFAGLAVLFTGISQTLLKIGAKNSKTKDSLFAAYLNLPVITGYFLFLMVTLFAVIALKEIPLKVYYSLTALNMIIVVACSYFILKENINKMQVIAVCIIVSGVIIFNL